MGVWTRTCATARSGFGIEAADAVGNSASGCGIKTRWIATVAVLLAVAGGPSAAAQSSPDLTGLSLEDLLDAEVVYAASRRIQTLREAASSVSVVTAAEIRAHGYRTLADVLRSLPSFYVTGDRRYSYVGVRGFNRPGDYGARVLLLLNGLRTNDNVYEQAYVGEEFLVDIDLVERIEVVRGPSAAMYGNGAFFAVVNVVTRQGRDFQGGELSASASSFGTGAARATYGRRFARDLDVLVSASLSDSGGRRLYFPEYDAPGIGDGIADRIDGERVERAMVTLSKGAFSFAASHVSRDKGIPTGAFGAAFGDPRTHSVDAKDLVSLTWARPLADGASAMARVHYGLSDYHGTYAYPTPEIVINDDSARGQWYGAEASMVRPLGARHLVTAGVEFQDDFLQRQLNFFEGNPPTVTHDSRNSRKRLAAFLQDEITLAPRLTLHLGMRQDAYEARDGFQHQTSPRLGLVYDDSAATTLKLLHGRAFRAPNAFELHFEGPGFRTNPTLVPETIRTTELVLERKLRRHLRLNVSAYFNEIDRLISVEREAASGLLVFRNEGRSRSLGLEAGLDLKRTRGPSGRVSGAWQHSHRHPTDEMLTNSPHLMVKAQVTWPLLGRRLTAGADGWYMSPRRTLAGAEAGPATATNVTLTSRIRGALEVSGSAYNVFDQRYADPGSPEHAQDLISQDGRHFRLKLAYRF